ncbi:hypothetical protein P7C73_g3766, partial [Tremellales sp. Uapishka_1]
MHLTVSLCKASSSSTRWLARQRSDPYVKLRTSNPDSPSFRSRSSFKLVSLAARHPSLLQPGKTIVDLGAAPGGWTQVASQLTKGKSKVFALDILPFEPIDHVVSLTGDFLSPEIQDRLKEMIQDQGVDTVLSDMMGKMSGVRSRDIQSSLDLVGAATAFARGVLKSKKDGEEVVVEGRNKVYPGGNLVLKYFSHPDMNEFRKTELEPYFAKVMNEKPKESRSESSEAYWVCLGFKGYP